MALYVEDWSARYGSPYLVSPDDHHSSAAEVVEDGGIIRAHRGHGPVPDRLAFVDGVRRLEATLYLDGKDGIATGVVGSHAAGAAVADGDSRMAFDRISVNRLAIFGSGAHEVLPPAHAFAWRTSSIADRDPEAPINELQTRMRQQEGVIAEDLAREGRLVIVDGPLNFVRSRDLPVVGHIKTHHRILLDPASQRHVPLLAAGERTSLFKLGTDRYSAYLRLATPRPNAGPWSGIVRIEIPQSAGLKEAIQTADEVALTLPRFAGIPWADPRAPQNLQPVAALERHLRHMLGDARLAARAVRAAVDARAREETA